VSWTIDSLLPAFDKRERHGRWIKASPERVWAALTALRMSDLRCSTALMRLRGGPPAWFGPLDGLDRPALEAFAPRQVAAREPEELLLADIGSYASMNPKRADIPRGDAQAFHDFAEPGWCKVVMNFLLVPERDGTRLGTETRVAATDPVTRRRFGLYWMMIRAGSGLIRHDILAGVARLAEKDHTAMTGQ
jgi:hypothetical protein